MLVDSAGYRPVVGDNPNKETSKERSASFALARINASKDPINPKKKPNPESGYIPPKKDPNPKKVPNPNGPGYGWPDNEGGVWVPDNRQHGGPGWTQQFPDGSHRHRYPDGHIRGFSAYAAGTIMITVGTIIVAVITIDDCTGLGIADDVVIAPAFGLISKGVEMIW